jgi:hypothetical protein
MKSAYFIIHPGKNPPQNGCRLNYYYYYYYIIFFNEEAPVSHPPLSQIFSQNQPAAIILNIGSLRTLARFASYR